MGGCSSLHEHRHGLFDEPFQAELARARADRPEGHPLAGRLAVGVFKVDEGTLPKILPQVLRRRR
jgi:hypothetical protein